MHINAAKQVVNLESLHPNSKFNMAADKIIGPNGEEYWRVHPARVLPTEDQNGVQVDRPNGFEVVQDKAYVRLQITDKTSAEQIARLELFKTAGVNTVNNMAEEERLKYISDGAGQAMTYLRKEDQAREYLSDYYTGLTYTRKTRLADIDFTTYTPAVPAPTDSEYSFLLAEVGQTGATVLDVAKTVLAKAEAWEDVIGPFIEGKRQTYQNQINAATSIAAVETIVSGASYTLPA